MTGGARGNMATLPLGRRAGCVWGNKRRRHQWILYRYDTVRTSAHVLLASRGLARSIQQSGETKNTESYNQEFGLPEMEMVCDDCPSSCFIMLCRSAELTMGLLRGIGLSRVAVLCAVAPLHRVRGNGTPLQTAHPSLYAAILPFFIEESFYFALSELILFFDHGISGAYCDASR